MLQLTRLSGPVFALNPDLIERAEATPDTVVTLVNGSKYVILESLEELISLIHAYRAGLVSAAQGVGGFTPASAYSNGGGHHGSHSAHSVRPVSPVPARRDPNANVVALHPGEE